MRSFYLKVQVKWVLTVLFVYELNIKSVIQHWAHNISGVVVAVVDQKHSA